MINYSFPSVEEFSSESGSDLFPVIEAFRREPA